MTEFSVKVNWQRNLQDPISEFLASKYSRGHSWSFDGGTVVKASASPEIVPLPWAVAENVDPEEAFVAALSSCHMLFFLDFASRKGLKVDAYSDNAQGFMGKNDQCKTVISKVILNPVVELTNSHSPPSHSSDFQSIISEIHHLSHLECFIANSVSTEVIINSEQ